MQGHHRSPAELTMPPGMETIWDAIPCILETSTLPWSWQAQPGQKSSLRGAGMVFGAEELSLPALALQAVQAVAMEHVA